MIRQDFSDLPPRYFLMLAMDKLAKIYCFLWDKKDDLNRVCFTWNDLTRYYNKNSFRTNLRKLNDGGLLNYDENEEGIAIELTSWEDIDNEFED